MRANTAVSMVSWAMLAALSLVVCSSVAFAADDDVTGSADYPGVGRFEGSVITRYDENNFDEYWLATGPVGADRDGEGRHLEGRVVRIAYNAGTNPSVLEVARNLERQLEAGGYDLLYTCETDECGGYDFRYYGTEVLPIPAMSVNLDNFRYIAATKPGNPETSVAILVTINNGRILYQVIAVENGAMENRMVDASQMKTALDDTGKIALYGIHFDTDETAIKPGSRPALDQIAKLMKDNSGLEILVVGHTDTQGSLDYNMDLSTRRAQAIVQELSGAYGISANRMTPAGVAFLAPVANNATAEGRAENRRVELVSR